MEYLTAAEARARGIPVSYDIPDHAVLVRNERGETRWTWTNTNLPRKEPT